MQGVGKLEYVGKCKMYGCFENGMAPVGECLKEYDDKKKDEKKGGFGTRNKKGVFEDNERLTKLGKEGFKVEIEK